MLEKFRVWIKEHVLEFIAGILVFLGVCAILWFGFRLTGNYTIQPNSDLDLESTAQVGDFIGGFVGALWSLAGVFLFYSALRMQRKEFNLQKEELREHRQEFIIARITNVIYQQLDKLSVKEEKLTYRYSPEFSNAVNTAYNTPAITQFINDFKESDFDGPMFTSYNDYIGVMKYISDIHILEHLQLIDRTFNVCISLIEQTAQSDRGANSSDKTLDSQQKHHLYTLLNTNLDYLQINDYLLALTSATDKCENIINADGRMIPFMREVMSGIPYIRNIVLKIQAKTELVGFN